MRARAPFAKTAFAALVEQMQRAARVDALPLQMAMGTLEQVKLVYQHRLLAAARADWTFVLMSHVKTLTLCEEMIPGQGRP